MSQEQTYELIRAKKVSAYFDGRRTLWIFVINHKPILYQAFAVFQL